MKVLLLLLLIACSSEKVHIDTAGDGVYSARIQGPNPLPLNHWLNSRPKQLAQDFEVRSLWALKRHHPCEESFIINSTDVELEKEVAKYTFSCADFEPACKEGDGGACLSLAVTLEKEQKRQEVYLPIYFRACELGVKESCYLAAQKVAGTAEQQKLLSAGAMLNHPQSSDELHALKWGGARGSTLLTPKKSDAATAQYRDFFATYEKSPGVQPIPELSNAYYKILRGKSISTGKRPRPFDSVLVRYRGRLPSGNEFDQSAPEGTRFSLTQIIPGLAKGLQLMEVGQIFEFLLPPELAYGEKQVGSIPAYSPLLFEVELLEIL